MVGVPRVAKAAVQMVDRVPVKVIFPVLVIANLVTMLLL